jgi:arylsulfatase A-like enzyme/Flp pilus assembly protein TadD
MMIRHGSKGTRVIHGGLHGANVLLVTIDTLRADHVGAYGGPHGLTPTLDGLAAEGLRFASVYSHVPLTLPSHTSLMTASYPVHNGVRDNGTVALKQGSPTLATALAVAGYRTAAFVAAFVLDARFGLNRGFDTYDDRMLGSRPELRTLQRNAEEVLSAARDWIVSRAAGQASSAPKRWFVWTHLYDPHQPYTPPEPYRSRYAADLYSGEVAYADAALGTFLRQLRATGALTNTLIVVTSDHGESLGEHGERTHGLFAYDATLRVPLIMWAPFQIRPTVFAEPVRLVDVAPTILDLLGLVPFANIDGRSIRPFVDGELAFEDSGSYFEALNANIARNWAPLTGMIWRGWKLIDLPIPELYDIASDPHEQRNLYAARRERARDLEKHLDTITNRASIPRRFASIDADADARLRSLGYAVGWSAKRAMRYTAAEDPKTLIHLHATLEDAGASWSRGDVEAAIRGVRRVIAERPDFMPAYDRLASMLRASGRINEAVSVLDEVAHDTRADRSLLRALAENLREAGELGRSADVLADLVKRDSSDLQSVEALGQTYARMGRTRQAEILFKRVIQASPNASDTLYSLGTLYLSESRTADAIKALSRAIAINPDLAAGHNALGVAYARRRDSVRALQQWRKALAIQPDFPDAELNLQRASK